ncbi:MAG: Diaminopimelate epimerase [Actinomycetota bacterium]|jgi:diaminopimelate epimerase
MSHLHLLKGHGTGNDFVILVDDEGRHDLSDDFVSALCDRNFGIGGDGLLRVVRTRFAAEAEIRELSDRAEWFMDYRNRDGSAAEMCGNGARVFGHFLHTTGRVGGDRFLIATRAGLKWIEKREQNLYGVEMGRAEISESEVSVTHGETKSATAVSMPNPHAVVMVDDLNSLPDFVQSPIWEPAAVFPEGVNVEYVQKLSPNNYRMRVFERGVGETLSCGTGACAVAAVAQKTAALELPCAVSVEVPGGELSVEIDIAGELTLVGPAELIAEFKLESEWLSHRGKI